MECKDCVNFKDCKEVKEEVCDDFKFNDTSELNDSNITSIAPEETEEEEEAEDTIVKSDTEKLKDSVNDLINSVSDAFKKGSINIKSSEQPKKKPFKIGFWGYLGIAVVAKASVEIAKAYFYSKNPRR